MLCLLIGECLELPARLSPGAGVRMSFNVDSKHRDSCLAYIVLSIVIAVFLEFLSGSLEQGGYPVSSVVIAAFRVGAVSLTLRLEMLFYKRVPEEYVVCNNGGSYDNGR